MPISDGPAEILVIMQSRACIEGIANQAAKIGNWRLRFCKDKDPRIPALLEGNQVKGAIVARVETSVHEIMKKIPVVVVNDTRAIGLCPCVLFDEHAIGVMAAEHLLQLGLRDLLWSGVHHEFSKKREAGFREAVERKGGRVFGKRWTWSNGTVEHIAQWLSQFSLPIGVGTCSDSMADLGMSALAYAGVQVPEQAALVGVDNNELVCELSMQSISSVDRNEQQIGELAMQRLIDMINGKKPDMDAYYMKPRFVVERNSTKMTCRTDPHLLKMLTYIREHAHQQIDVHDLVRVSGYARATLFRKCKSEFQLNPAQLIRRERLERARKLLLDTDLGLEDIAIRSGFATASHFSRCFRQAYNQSPGAYR